MLETLSEFRRRDHSLRRTAWKRCRAWVDSTLKRTQTLPHNACFYSNDVITSNYDAALWRRICVHKRSIFHQCFMSVSVCAWDNCRTVEPMKRRTTTEPAQQQLLWTTEEWSCLPHTIHHQLTEWSASLPTLHVVVETHQQQNTDTRFCVFYACIWSFRK